MIDKLGLDGLGGASVRVEPDRGLLGRIDDLQAQLAASQAREQQLREALQEALADVSWGVNSGLSGLRDTERDISDALSLPQDDTALRQWGAKLLREMAMEIDYGTEETEQAGITLCRKAKELEIGK